jgi:hypothetical protein
MIVLRVQPQYAGLNETQYFADTRIRSFDSQYRRVFQSTSRVVVAHS